MDKPVCKFFLESRCTKGDQCNFNHILVDPKNSRDPGSYNKNKNKSKLNRTKLVKVNTETFEPWYEPPHMQVIVLDPKKPNPDLTESDVFLLSGLFDELEQKSGQDVYSKLLDEIEGSGKPLDQLWKPWHGDKHLIADDHLRWKEFCPIFNSIINKISEYFNMDVKATRFNLYEDLRDYKPMHFDAAAIDPKKAATQNLTIGVSFGYTRSIEFEHATNRCRVSFPITNGTIYGFGKQINIDWRHGIPPIKPEIIESINSNNSIKSTGRVSIIAWGKSNQKKI